MKYEDERKRSLSVILPVINEKENLKYLIPQIFEIFEGMRDLIEIIVVDDGSTDGTNEFINQVYQAESRLKYFERLEPKSLPESINLGIKFAKHDSVAWLDADGSMPILDLYKMATTFQTTSTNCVIGSRFVTGGGFKGLKIDSNNSIFAVVRRLHESQDSLIAVVLSRILNMYLRFCLNANIKDLTSGFIVIDKTIMLRNRLLGGYGDYFPRLVFNLKRENVNITEIGYYCEPRIFGKSKTGTNLFQLIKTGVPYAVLGTKILLSRIFRRGSN